MQPPATGRTRRPGAGCLHIVNVAGNDGSPGSGRRRQARQVRQPQILSKPVDYRLFGGNSQNTNAIYADLAGVNQARQLSTSHNSSPGILAG
jgi:hypothetical protein